MQHRQMPLLQLVPPDQATGSETREQCAMREIARFIRDRASDLPQRSDVARELAYVAIRLELAARSPHPQAAAGHQETG